MHNIVFLGPYGGNSNFDIIDMTIFRGLVLPNDAISNLLINLMKDDLIGRGLGLYINQMRNVTYYTALIHFELQDRSNSNSSP
jgi:hypothetical protein